MIFLILSIVVLNSIAILIPKRMTKIEMYATILFSLVFELVTNLFLEFKYDLYGYFEDGVHWKDLMPILGLYPATNVIILNYYPFIKSKTIKAYYIIGWSALLVLFEWASVQASFFYHNGWKYWHSALAYPVIIFILTWGLRFIRKLLKQNTWI